MSVVVFPSPTPSSHSWLSYFHQCFLNSRSQRVFVDSFIRQRSFLGPSGDLMGASVTARREDQYDLMWINLGLIYRKMITLGISSDKSQTQECIFIVMAVPHIEPCFQHVWMNVKATTCWLVDWCVAAFAQCCQPKCVLFAFLKKTNHYKKKNFFCSFIVCTHKKKPW